MGCGHSKINIYPKRSRNKSNNKKSVTSEKSETEEDESTENEQDNNENLEDCLNSKKIVKVKPFGGPLLAQQEISTSQQDFFRMLEEKIENSPDYNAESEFEKAAESARIRALLKDWETASVTSRSLPVTPKRRIKQADKVRPNSNESRCYKSQLPQALIHQSYGVTAQHPVYYHPSLPPTYAYSPSHHQYPSALQYQAISPMYPVLPQPRPPPLPPPPPKPYPYAAYNALKFTAPHPPHLPSFHDPPAPPYSYPMGVGVAPPPPPPQPIYSNGEFLQKHFYNQMAYQAGGGGGGGRVFYNAKNYQTSVTIPIVVQNNQGGELVHRKQYELT